MMLDLIDVIRLCNFAASPCAKVEQYVYAAATTGTSGRFFITSDMATARPCWLFTLQKIHTAATQSIRLGFFILRLPLQREEAVGLYQPREP